MKSSIRILFVMVFFVMASLADAESMCCSFQPTGTVTINKTLYFQHPNGNLLTEEACKKCETSETRGKCGMYIGALPNSVPELDAKGNPPRGYTLLEITASCKGANSLQLRDKIKIKWETLIRKESVHTTIVESARLIDYKPEVCKNGSVSNLNFPAKILVSENDSRILKVASTSGVVYFENIEHR